MSGDRWDGTFHYDPRPYTPPSPVREGDVIAVEDSDGNEISRVVVTAVSEDGLKVTAEPVDGVPLYDSTVRRRNLAAIRHEMETPMRDHDEDGECCRRAREG